MPKYQLVIDDAQRQYLITALTQCQLQGYFGADAEGREEIDLMVGMLESALDDGTVNDFTA